MSDLRFTTIKILQVGGVTAATKDQLALLPGSSEVDDDAVQIDIDDLETALSISYHAGQEELTSFINDVLVYNKTIVKAKAFYFY